MQLGSERRVGEHRLHKILAVVEGSLDRQIADVRRQHGRHLPPLHVARPSPRMQDDDVHPRPGGKRLDRGGAGVAGGCRDDGDVLAALGQHMVEQPAQQLHRHVLEGERRAVEQLLHPEPGVELYQRRDRGVAKSRRRLPGKGAAMCPGLIEPAAKGWMTRAANSA